MARIAGKFDLSLIPEEPSPSNPDLRVATVRARSALDSAFTRAHTARIDGAHPGKSFALDQKQNF